MGLSARLDALDRAIAGAGVQWGRIERELGDLKERPGPEIAINDLKKSLKDFTSALVLQVLGGGVPPANADTDMEV